MKHTHERTRSWRWESICQTSTGIRTYGERRHVGLAHLDTVYACMETRLCESLCQSIMAHSHSNALLLTLPVLGPRPIAFIHSVQSICTCRGTSTQLTIQPPVQINSLTGTYATSTYLAALKKSPKDLESLAKDIEAFDKKIKEDEKVAAFIRECYDFLRAVVGLGASVEEGSVRDEDGGGGGGGSWVRDSRNVRGCQAI